MTVRTTRATWDPYAIIKVSVFSNIIMLIVVVIVVICLLVGLIQLMIIFVCCVLRVCLFVCFGFRLFVCLFCFVLFD